MAIHSIEEKVFIATPGGRGLARAWYEGDDWQVASVLAGEDVRCLATDPRRPDMVYAGTQGNGLWRSADRGNTWQRAGLAGRVVKCVAASATTEGVLYAGLKPALVAVSRDDGETWTDRESFRRIRGRRFWFSPADPPSLTAYVQDIVLSPTDDQVVVAGVEAGATVLSEDGGHTWSNHRPGSLRDCHSLYYHISDPNWVYEAGGTGGGAAVSQDGGRTWRQPKEGLDRHYGWACAADPAEPTIWYASISPAGLTQPQGHVDGDARTFIFRSRGGGPWQKLGGGLPQPLDYMAYALMIDPQAPGHLYAGLANGDVWHTADHGDNWRQLPFNLGGIHRSAVIVQRLV